ncbi:MAG TPA: hypothetical protein VGH49_04360, partial [Xanthobacteraceae bacterium]
ERDGYPAMPRGYFDHAATDALTTFGHRAQAERREELLADFPIAAAERGLRNLWRPSAAGIYRNWLAGISAQKNRRIAPVGFRAATRVAAPAAGRRIETAAEDCAPHRAPFIERRRRADPAGEYNGARDRRVSA